MGGWKNKEDRKKYMDVWETEHKKERREYKRIYNKNKRKEVGDWYKEYKRNLKCSKCGETFYACLEFHHKGGDKNTEVARLVSNALSIERVKKEIEKCIILCSNCHRKEHFKNGSLV